MTAPASPCIALCRLDRRDICQGCGRTLDEIAEWGEATPERQQAIVDAARGRMAAAIGSVGSVW